jgi:hypothetical protein
MHAVLPAGNQGKLSHRGGLMITATALPGHERNAAAKRSGTIQ